MEELFVSRIIFDGDTGNYVALTNKDEKLICVMGPSDEPDNVENAHRLRLALELISEIPTDVLEEIRSRQFTPQERVEILRFLRLAWYSANRMNRLPVHHVGLKVNPEP
jgi:hypothetical protein